MNVIRLQSQELLSKNISRVERGWKKPALDEVASETAVKRMWTEYGWCRGCNPCLVVDLDHPKIWEKTAQLKEGQEFGNPADSFLRWVSYSRYTYYQDDNNYGCTSFFFLFCLRSAVNLFTNWWMIPFQITTHKRTSRELSVDSLGGGALHMGVGVLPRVWGKTPFCKGMRKPFWGVK